MMKTLKQIQRMAVVLCGVATLWSCSDENIISNNNGRLITFTTEDNWGDTPAKSRAQQSQESPEAVYKMESEDGASKLYLRTTITDMNEVNTTANGAVSRGTLINSLADLTSFKVYGYWKENADDTTPALYIINEKFTKGTDGTTWEGNAYWPVSGSLKFYAIAPYEITANTTGDGEGLTTPTEAGSFSYTVPTDVANQKDLMVATVSGEGMNPDGYFPSDYDSSPSLSFRHLLSGIQFEIAEGTEVSSIRFLKVKNQGTYHLNSSETEWALDSSTGDFCTDPDESVTTQTFMMLPQEFGEDSDATIRIEYSDHTYKDVSFASLKNGDNNHTWPMGSILTYIISRTRVDYVDLGLSVLWATCNVGASSPVENGNFYAWGETAVKTAYSWRSYTYTVGNNSTDFNEYNSTDQKTVLDLEDDAAYINKGNGCRMPTQSELEELYNIETTGGTKEWTDSYEESGKPGYIFRGNGNEIFLPAAGDKNGSTSKYNNQAGHYWSSTRFSAVEDGIYLFFCSEEHKQTNSVKELIEVTNNERRFGFSVRPVMDKPAN